MYLLKYSKGQKDAIEISTKGFQKKAIEGPMRLPIGKMTSKGSCNNGPLFDEFFHPKNREHRNCRNKYTLKTRGDTF